MKDERVTFRDDLDQLDDDETLVDDPDVRRAKALFVICTVVIVTIATVIMVLVFRPEGQVFIERWPNSYLRTRTTYVEASNAAGRIPHGKHQAWHANGILAEEGRYEQGAPVGEWSYWDATGNELAGPPE